MGRLKLVDGEQVVVRTRAHRRTLIPALVNLLIAAAVVSFLLGYLSRGSQPEFVRQFSGLGLFVVWSLGALTLFFGTVRPFLQWLNRLTFLTNLRIVQKNLVGPPEPIVAPLGLISEVQLRTRRIQSVSGAGDLIVLSGAYGQQQRTVLADMPDAAHFHTVAAEELGEYRRRAAEQQASRLGPAGYAAPGGYGNHGGYAGHGGYGGRSGPGDSRPYAHDPGVRDG
ncbi:MAG: hypothetical protein Q4F53_05925 [Nesterenkonia sp.]|uniref:hypothetical protein n=1 Tax=Nesterenkonia marinintestina TaxID=2979865 RepID=UPI0021C1257E|nr:hypothetical protein [Nesterenkonia sp. GX14115]MDO5493135.1 hypothetical protein [Nesterenkonia sp.]